MPGKSAPNKPEDEQFEEALAGVRVAYRLFIDDTKAGMEAGTEINKQIGAFYERMMFLAFGTIAISITAVTSFASRFAVPGFHKYTVDVALALAWLLLLGSAFLSRRVMLTIIAANRTILQDWSGLVGEYHKHLLASRHKLARSTETSRTADAYVNIDTKEVVISLERYLQEQALKDRINGFHTSLTTDRSSLESKLNPQVLAVRTLSVALLILGAVAVYFVSALR